MEDRIADWLKAYNAVSTELSPETLRALVKLTENPANANVAMIQLGMQAAGIVFANDRAAAVTAAMLTQSGLSKPTLGVIEGGD